MRLHSFRATDDELHSFTEIRSGLINDPDYNYGKLMFNRCIYPESNLNSEKPCSSCP